MLGAALLLQLGADIVYAGLTAVGAYSGGLLDLGWMVSYLCWALPHCTRPCARCRRWRRPGVRVTRRRLLVLAPAALIAPAVLLYQGSRDLPIDWAALGLGSVVLFLLVARLSELVARVQDQAAQQSPEQLIGIADDALYKARHQGRNRVVATPSPAAQPGERSSNPIGSAPPS